MDENIDILCPSVLRSDIEFKERRKEKKSVGHLCYKKCETFYCSRLYFHHGVIGCMCPRFYPMIGSLLANLNHVISIIIFFVKLCLDSQTKDSKPRNFILI